MTTSLTEGLENTVKSKIGELKAVGKRYPFPASTGCDLSRELTDFWALKGVSFDVYQSEVLGIIGRNGAGKTTLLNIIAGSLSPSEGRLSIKGKALGLFNLGIGFQDELTGRENIFLNGTILGAAKKELQRKLDEIIAFSELDNFIEMPLGSYSQGMRLRLGFGIIANLDFEVLVLDEVLAVGDVLFQNKCYQRLLDFKREGKTLIITTQGMEMIERLCDRAILLDHGKLIFCGKPQEGIAQYRALLSAEKFYVGPAQKKIELVENTKRWADDVAYWGKEFGTKEVMIEKVELLDGLGRNRGRIKSGERLRVKVGFRARDKVKEPHFGVAIFRADGVYCYGPNTLFDGYEIKVLGRGEGYFILDYPKLLLAPGEYRISVAIWDKNEVLSYNYHEGYYKLNVEGHPHAGNELLRLPFRFLPDGYIGFLKKDFFFPDSGSLNNSWGKKADTGEVALEAVKLLDGQGRQKEVFMANEAVNIQVRFNTPPPRGRNLFFWAGIYRDDGVYCQGLAHRFSAEDLKIVFAKLPLLPGGYKLSLGIWDTGLGKFIILDHGAYPFRMVSERRDHGTVYLEHKWQWKLP